MKIFHYILLSLVLSSIVASCDEPESAPQRLAPAVIEEDEAEETMGDRHIGIYVIKEEQPKAGLANVEYQHTEALNYVPAAGSEAIVLFSEDGNVTFEAYAPYDAGLTRFDPVYRVEDWCDQTDTEAIDLLVADAVEDRSVEAPDVLFRFRHVFAKLRLRFSLDASSGLQTQDLEGLTVEIDGANRGVGYHLLKHQADVDNTANTSPVKMLTGAGGKTATAILPPEGANTYLPTGRKVRIALANGRSYKWDVPDNLLLAAGKCTTWNLILTSQTEVIFSNCLIEDWSNADMGDIELELDE